MLEFFTLDHPIAELAIAALLGGFLGLRREIDAQDFPKKRSFMGFRTMTILASMGAVSTFFPEIWFLPAIFFAGIAALVAIAYAHGSFAQNRIGITTELSALLTFWIGVLVGIGEPFSAVMAALLLASLNAFKDHLHDFAKILTKKEWVGALELLILSIVALPFLPREPVDPWGALVPLHVWILIMLISGIGFFGYFFIKFFGARGGIPLIGFLGSIVSSTAVTTSLAAQEKKSRATKIFVVGILIALATMQIRVLAELIFLGGEHFFGKFLWLPAAMAIASGLTAWHFFQKTKKSIFQPKPKIALEQPFEILPAIKFGVIFVAVLLALALGQKYFGSSGVYAAAFFSGIIDIDAIVLSSMESVKLGEMSPEIAKNAIAIALFVNTLIKIMFVATLGSRKLLKKITLATLAITATGVVLFILV